MQRSYSIARWISIVAHPFSCALLLVAVAGAKLYGAGTTAGLVALTSLSVILPLWFFMWRKWRTGQWRTIDASLARERPPFYVLALLLLAILTGAIALLHGGGPFLRGCVAVAGLLACAALLNRWIKLSQHVAFAAFTAVVLLEVDFAISILLALLVPIVAWSRLVLARHSMSEVIGGALLGVAIAVAFRWLAG